MSKFYKLLFTSVLGLFLLSACGTSAQEGEEVTGSSPNGSEQGESTAAPEKPVKEEPAEDTDKEGEPAQPETPGDEDVDAAVRGEKKVLTYKLQDEQKETEAALTASDNQEYSMYVLPEYELTGEEPYKDVLFLKEDDSNFMRIEMLPAEISMDDAVETIKEQLKTVNPEVEEVTDVAGHDWLKESKVFVSKKDGEQVNGYLIPKENWTLKLTIFQKEDRTYEEAFLKMAETIEAKQ